MRKTAKKVLVGFAVLAAVLVIAGVAGFLYLRNSEWWITFTLFSDDTRVENFRSFHTLFPAERTNPGDAVWRLESWLRACPRTSSAGSA